ncbi:MAG: VOC family protein [Pseudonocardiaceae bacterium]
MKIARQIVVFDATDLTAESTFWAGLLGGTVDAEDDWHSVYVDGEPRLGIQLAPNHVPPEWPDGTSTRIPLGIRSACAGADAHRLRNTHSGR